MNNRRTNFQPFSLFGVDLVYFSMENLQRAHDSLSEDSWLKANFIDLKYGQNNLVEQIITIMKALSTKDVKKKNHFNISKTI